MKVCLINSLYHPHTRGGAERVVQTTAELLHNAGHEVVVITTEKESKKAKKQKSNYQLYPPSQKLGSSLPSMLRRMNPRALKLGSLLPRGVHKNIKVYRVHSRNLCSFYDYTQKQWWFRLVWLMIDLVNIFVARDVVNIITKEKFDIVHTHNLRGLSYILLRFLKRTGITHVHTLHDIQYAYPSGLLIYGNEKSIINTFFLRTLYENVCTWLLGSPQAVVSPSQWLMDFYIDRGFFKESQKVVIQNPVKSISFTQDTHVKKHNDTTFNLLFIGQIEEHKGILFLMDTLEKLQVMGYRLRITLDIIGAGSLLKQVQQRAIQNPHSTFHGQLPHKQLNQFYNKADIVVVPSLTYENAPTVILEAYQHGVPVLVSRLGGIPEFVQNKKTGWLFEPGDKESFCEAFIQAQHMVGDEAGEKEIKQNCLDFSNTFSSSIYIQKLSEIYNTNHSLIRANKGVVNNSSLEEN